MTTSNTTLPPAASDRIIQAMAREIKDYERKAQATEGDLQQGFLLAKENLIGLAKARLTHYGVADAETVMTQLLERVR